MYYLRSKRVVEKQIWGRLVDGDYPPEPRFQKTDSWEWGQIGLSEEPDLTNYDPDVGINLYEVFDFDDWEFSDGRTEWEFQDSFSLQARQRLIELNEVGDPVEDGWEVIESETWFYGPLEVVRE